MSESLKLPYCERSLSLDRADIFDSSLHVYPETYQKFQKFIESIFFKSELIIKCKLEFDRLVTMDFPDKLAGSESLNQDLNLSLIFTGAIKSGRSSLINMLLKTKVMPTNIIGSSCGVTITHPKHGAKPISIGVLDIDGWEVERHSDLEIYDLPTKIESLQYSLAKKSCEKNSRNTKRIHVQLPHWLLKNINIYECPAIDGIYSFDEPFDIILHVEHPILIHVIDASNGLMQWDKTFLAKTQHKWPHLPIFFVINHVDIPADILCRDQGPRFESISDKFRNEYRESESSDHYSTDEYTSESDALGAIYNEKMVLSAQKNLVDKCKKQLRKLGFMLENHLSIRFAALSVKEFLKILRLKETDKNCYWTLVEQFFETFRDYLSTWLEMIIITSSLDHKSRINGVVDAMRCQIVTNDEILQDFTNNTYFEEIRLADRKIKDEFFYVHKYFEKEITNSVKNQLKGNEHLIRTSLPDLSCDDNNKLIHIVRPKLRMTFEKLLLGNADNYDINDVINCTLDNCFKRLELFFKNIYTPNRWLNFFQYIHNLFRTLKRAIVYPLLLYLPDDIMQSESKWYHEVLKALTRKILGTNIGHHNLIVELIEDINISSLIRHAQSVLSVMNEKIQRFTRRYEEIYRMALKNIISPEVFKKLLLEDFVIKVIEKSFRKPKSSLIIEDLIKVPMLFNEFFDYDGCMIKCINIQSFTSLSDVINILCFKRICPHNQYVMVHKSTQLLDNGLCLLYYTKTDYDLLNAIQKQTEWQVNDIIGIINQLLNAIKSLQIYHKYLQIDLLPENIMLRNNNRGRHDCMFYPFTAEISSIGYNYRSKRKFLDNAYGVIFQLGMVLCWLLTNDIFVCKMISSDNTCTLPEFKRHITERILGHLRESDLISTALNLLYRPEDYTNIDLIRRELHIRKENV